MTEAKKQFIDFANQLHLTLTEQNIFLFLEPISINRLFSQNHEDEMRNIYISLQTRIRSIYATCSVLLPRQNKIITCSRGGCRMQPLRCRNTVWNAVIYSYNKVQTSGSSKPTRIHTYCMIHLIYTSRYSDIVPLYNPLTKVAIYNAFIYHYS